MLSVWPLCLRWWRRRRIRIPDQRLRDRHHLPIGEGQQIHQGERAKRERNDVQECEHWRESRLLADEPEGNDPMMKAGKINTKGSTIKCHGCSRSPMRPPAARVALTGYQTAV